jgi:hypothetical protein
MRWLLPVVLVAALAGCATGTPLPAPPTGAVPDVAGTWRGTWGDQPAALLITSQDVDAGYSGIFVGSGHVLGPRRPGVAGVLTSTIRGRQVSARAEGWLGADATGRAVLLIQAETPDGGQRLTLTRVGEDQLQGMGESTFRWGPSGTARLIRQAR